VAHSLAMSMAEWHLDKADRCARSAKHASDARPRANLEIERILWLQIAEQIDKGPKSSASLALPLVAVSEAGGNHGDQS
jgi:hypothetical protein